MPHSTPLLTMMNRSALYVLFLLRVLGLCSCDAVFEPSHYGDSRYSGNSPVGSSYSWFDDTGPNGASSPGEHFGRYPERPMLSGSPLGSFPGTPTVPQLPQSKLSAALLQSDLPSSVAAYGVLPPLLNSESLIASQYAQNAPSYLQSLLQSNIPENPYSTDVPVYGLPNIGRQVVTSSDGQESILLGDHDFVSDTDYPLYDEEIEISLPGLDEVIETSEYELSPLEERDIVRVPILTGETVLLPEYDIFLDTSPTDTLLLFGNDPLIQSDFGELSLSPSLEAELVSPSLSVPSSEGLLMLSPEHTLEMPQTAYTELPMSGVLNDPGMLFATNGLPHQPLPDTSPMTVSAYLPTVSPSPLPFLTGENTPFQNLPSPYQPIPYQPYSTDMLLEVNDPFQTISGLSGEQPLSVDQYFLLPSTEGELYPPTYGPPPVTASVSPVYPVGSELPLEPNIVGLGSASPFSPSPSIEVNYMASSPISYPFIQPPTEYQSLNGDPFPTLETYDSLSVSPSYKETIAKLPYAGYPLSSTTNYQPTLSDTSHNQYITPVGYPLSESMTSAPLVSDYGTAPYEYPSFGSQFSENSRSLFVPHVETLELIDPSEEILPFSFDFMDSYSFEPYLELDIYDDILDIPLEVDYHQPFHLPNGYQPAPLPCTHPSLTIPTTNFLPQHVEDYGSLPPSTPQRFSPTQSDVHAVPTTYSQLPPLYVSNPSTTLDNNLLAPFMPPKYPNTVAPNVNVQAPIIPETNYNYLPHSESGNQFPPFYNQPDPQATIEFSQLPDYGKYPYPNQVSLQYPIGKYAASPSTDRNIKKTVPKAQFASTTPFSSPYIPYPMYDNTMPSQENPYNFLNTDYMQPLSYSPFQFPTYDSQPFTYASNPIPTYGTQPLTYSPNPMPTYNTQPLTYSSNLIPTYYSTQPLTYSSNQMPTYDTQPLTYYPNLMPTYDTHPLTYSPNPMPTYDTQPLTYSPSQMPTYDTQPLTYSPNVMPTYDTQPLTHSPNPTPTYDTQPLTYPPNLMPTYDTQPFTYFPNTMPIYDTQPLTHSPNLMPTYDIQPVKYSSYMKPTYDIEPLPFIRAPPSAVWSPSSGVPLATPTLEPDHMQFEPLIDYPSQLPVLLQILIPASIYISPNGDVTLPIEFQEIALDQTTVNALPVPYTKGYNQPEYLMDFLQQTLLPATNMFPHIHPGMKLSPYNVQPEYFPIDKSHQSLWNLAQNTFMPSASVLPEMHPGWTSHPYSDQHHFFPTQGISQAPSIAGQLDLMSQYPTYQNHPLSTFDSPFAPVLDFEDDWPYEQPFLEDDYLSQMDIYDDYFDVFPTEILSDEQNLNQPFRSPEITMRASQQTNTQLLGKHEGSLPNAHLDLVSQLPHLSTG